MLSLNLALIFIFILTGFCVDKSRGKNECFVNILNAYKNDINKFLAVIIT